MRRGVRFMLLPVYLPRNKVSAEFLLALILLCMVRPKGQLREMPAQKVNSRNCRRKHNRRKKRLRKAQTEVRKSKSVLTPDSERRCGHVKDEVTCSCLLPY